LSKIEYKIMRTNTWETIDGKPSFGGDFYIEGYDFTMVTFRNKKGHKLNCTWLNGHSITYNNDGAKKICIEINVESLMKEKILEEKRGIYKLLINIIMANRIPYSISIPHYEITSFDDDQRKYISLSPYEVMIRSFSYALGTDLGLRIKLEFDLSITFENINDAKNIEIREQALRKFGYEKYVKEGWGKGRILTILTNEEILMGPKHKMYNSSLYEESRIKALIKHTKEECIIYMDNEISFLKVRDTSTNKTYFLKIPPEIKDIKEAKAWTFGLKKEEYKPVIET